MKLMSRVDNYIEIQDYFNVYKYNKVIFLFLFYNMLNTIVFSWKYFIAIVYNKLFVVAMQTNNYDKRLFYNFRDCRYFRTEK